MSANDLSSFKKKAVDMSNHNLVEKARIKVNRIVRFHARPTKDKNGRNIKKHFGVWKYFVNKNDIQAKQKFYISLNCRKIPEN